MYISIGSIRWTYRCSERSERRPSRHGIGQRAERAILRDIDGGMASCCAGPYGRRESLIAPTTFSCIVASPNDHAACLAACLRWACIAAGQKRCRPSIQTPCPENGKNEDPLGSNRDKAMADRPTQPPMYRTILVMEENSQIVNILLHLSSSRFISRNLCLSFLPIARWSTSLAVQRMGFSSRSLWLW